MQRPISCGSYPLACFFFQVTVQNSLWSRFWTPPDDFFLFALFEKRSGVIYGTIANIYATTVDIQINFLSQKIPIVPPPQNKEVCHCRKFRWTFWQKCFFCISREVFCLVQSSTFWTSKFKIVQKTQSIYCAKLSGFPENYKFVWTELKLSEWL